MTIDDVKVVRDQNSFTNPNAITGMIFSGLGLAGWLTLLAVLCSTQYEAYSGDGQRDMVIGLGNGLTYFVKVVTGIIGLLVNGALSLVGLIVSLLGLNYEPTRASYPGIAMGSVGILIGLGIVLWRMTVWGIFLNH